MLKDAISGQINYAFPPIGNALPFVKDNKLVALAVSTAVRSPILPAVPTVAEAGLAGFEFEHWHGLFAPTKTPRPVVEKISKQVARVVAFPQVREAFTNRSAVPKTSTPEQFDKFVRAESEKLGKLIKAAGIKVE